MGYIYLVRNKKDEKCYVGQTIRTLKERKIQHLSETRLKNDNTYFHNAIRKYGEENFEWKILKKVKNKNELDELERFYIQKFNSLAPNGYNLDTGGNKNKSLSEATKIKMSKNHADFSGKKNSFYGKHHSKESLKKISENNAHYWKGKKLPESIKQNMKQTWEKKNVKRQQSKAHWGKGLFGYTGGYYKYKNKKPWYRVWYASIIYNRKRNSLGYFNDPLSAQIVYKFVWNEIYNTYDKE